MERNKIEQYNYNVDDYGTLKVYEGLTSMILFEISDCQGMTKKELIDLIEEVIEERDL